METCKQVPWCQFSADESKKDEESSSCSQHHHHHLNMSSCDRMHEELECSMCGDVGLTQYLFKCLTCSHRYQHIYCGKFYPYRIEATMCNWCLPMEQLRPNTPLEVDDTHNMKASDCINYYNRITKPDIDAIPNRQIDHHVQKPAQHTMAFEYLLQVAELLDRGHQWDHHLCPLEEADNIIGKISATNYVAHRPCNQISGIHKMDHSGMKLCNMEPSSLLMPQIISSGCSDDQDRSYCSRRGHKIESVKRTSTQLQYNHNYACTVHNQIGMNPDMVNSQITKKDLHDRIMKKLNNRGLPHTQTIEKFYDQRDEGNAQQEPAVLPVKGHGMGCSINDDQSVKCRDALGAKRARLHKQLQAAVGTNQHNINAADQQKTDSGQDTSYTGCGDDSDEQLEGNLGENIGAGVAKHPRHRQPRLQVIAGDNYGLNCANRQRLVNANSNDQENTAAEDQTRVLCINRSSPARQHAAAWSRAAAGKRDHLMNSPSRAINRRYKRLADVLC